MSFVMGERTKELDDEIQDATKRGIVMTCATHDEGYKIDKAWPADYHGDTASLLVLAACDEYGRVLREFAKNNCDYLIRGRNVAAGVIPFLKSEDTISGSSVATALAAGLCSLILTCDREANPKREYEEGKDKGSRFEKVNFHLKEMQATDGSNFILLEKFGKIDTLGKGGSGCPSAEKVLKHTFADK
jgi:hypothetical protein